VVSHTIQHQMNDTACSVRAVMAYFDVLFLYLPGGTANKQSEAG